MGVYEGNMPLLKNIPIKYKLFLAYAVVSLVVLSISFVLLFFEITRHIENGIITDLNKSNQSITDLVETAATVSIRSHLKGITEKNKEIVAHLYSDFQAGFITEPEARKQAETLLLSQSVGQTGYIYCVNGKGVITVHPHSQVLGQNLSKWAFIQQQKKQKNGYIEYNWKNPDDEEEKPKVLYMSYFEPWDWIISVSSYKSEFATLVSIEDFKQRILGLTVGKTGYSFVFDTNGNMVIHPHATGNFIDFKDSTGRDLFHEMVSKKRGFITYFWVNPAEKDPREKYVAFCYIPYFDWIVASSSYVDEVFAPLNRLKQTFFIIAILTCLILAGVSLLVSESIVQPLNALIFHFKKGAKGDLASRIDQTGQDELGRLAASFNLFMDRISAYQEDISTEISHRKKTESELKAFRRLLINILDSIPSIIIGLDHDMKVASWNAGIEKSTGISREEAIAKHIRGVLPRIEPHLPVIARSMETGQICQVKRVPCPGEDGEDRFETITISPLSGTMKTGVVVRIDDVTEAIRMEEALIQNEKMLSVGGLAAGMAHEINNPLAGVLQNANLLAFRLSNTTLPANVQAAEKIGLSMETLKAYMESRAILKTIAAINEAGSRMADIVANMLSFARKGSTVFSTHKPGVLMDKILDIAATDYDLKQQYDFKTIIIEKEYESDLPDILCEGSKIQQVLLNVLTNGAQAMVTNPPDTPPMFIIRISSEKETRMMRMEIEDNGPGMASSVKKRVFEPFFTTKPVGVGTGLGLSVSYFIITKNHNGTMEVESSPGQGARFIIRLPLI